MSTTVTGQVLALKGVEIAKGFARAGLHEATGHNDGPEIDHIESFWGLRNASWCAMLVMYSLMKGKAYLEKRPTDDATLAMIKREITAQFILTSCRCTEIRDDAKKRGIWHEGTKGMRQGDIALYNFDSDPEPEHIGFYLGNGQFVEGNTSKGDSGSQDNGQGAYIKPRSFSLVQGYVRLK